MHVIIIFVSGLILIAISIPIGISTSHKVEATTALYTIRLAMDFGYQNLWMEGDSLNIINMLNNNSPVSWTIEGSILEIKNLINKFDMFYFLIFFRREI